MKRPNRDSIEFDDWVAMKSLIVSWSFATFDHPYFNGVFQRKGEGYVQHEKNKFFPGTI